MEKLERWSQAKLAKFLDCDPSVVSRAVSRGIIQRNDDWLKQTRGLFRYHCETASGRTGDDDISLAVERAKLARAQTQKINLEMKKVGGEFVSLKAICEGIESVMLIIRSKLLALPHRIKSKNPQLDNKVLTVIDEQVRETLTELANSKLPANVAQRIERINREDLATPINGTQQEISAPKQTRAGNRRRGKVKK